MQISQILVKDELEEDLNPSFYYVVVRKNKSYYFLSEDKQSVTRNSTEAFKLYPLKNYTHYGMERYAKENIVIPEGYECYTIFAQRQAQKWLDEDYPLPRKAISKKVRQAVYDMFDGHCAYCGCKIDFKDMQVDHIESHMINKGIDDISNYYPSCKDCNKFKLCSPIERFRKNIKDTIKTCSKRNTDYLWDIIYKKYGLDKEPNKEIKFYFEKAS